MKHRSTTGVIGSVMVALASALVPCAAGHAWSGSVDGRVVLRDGTPVRNAVVVSSSGGQAITDEHGRFALELSAAANEADVRVTAFASRGGTNFSGTMPTDAGADDDIVLMEAQGDGECDPSWMPGFFPAGTNDKVIDLAVFDDGAGGGPALYVCGSFTTAGGASANRVARWDGTTWSAVGSGMNDVVLCLAVFDDGSGAGPALYAGGLFTTAGGSPADRIAKWNGSAWSAVGSGLDGSVEAMVVFDDGSGAGPAVYAGGSFGHSGAVTVQKIARWNGSTWSSVGGGMGVGSVFALTAIDAGEVGGPALYAGGSFSTAGFVNANRVAKWNGAIWSACGGGANDTVWALATYDDGSGGGPALYVGGSFMLLGDLTPASRIAKWNGTAWSTLGSGTNQPVYSLLVFDDGAGGGPLLHVGGAFTMAGGAQSNRVARWNGSAWTATIGGVSDTVNALAAFDDGSGDGPDLIVGGNFVSSSSLVQNRITKWDGSKWSALGGGVNFTPTGGIYAFAVFDDGLGGGPALYAGGQFTTAGSVVAQRLARWDGSSWSAVGGGLDSSVFALAVFDDGSGGGPALYAAGGFQSAGGVAANRIAKWNGSAWSALGSGMNGTVWTLAVFDDGLGGGSALYAGGEFTMAGGVAVDRIAQWNGASWSGVGDGVNQALYRLAVIDDGSGDGAELYAGGNFTIAGTVGANFVAKWNGTSWSALGNGMNAWVDAFALFDDGSGGGPLLYAAGSFTAAGGVACNRIARWNGASWSPVGDGTDNIVRCLSVFDDGTGGGPALYACGEFGSAGGVAVNRIAKWNGAAWSSLDGGVQGTIVRTLAVLDGNRGERAALFAGGSFTVAGDVPSSCIARWQGCPVEPPCSAADFDCDGVVDGNDLGTLLGQWGACPGCAADFNGDGMVDGDDLGALLGAWS